MEKIWFKSTSRNVLNKLNSSTFMEHIVWNSTSNPQRNSYPTLRSTSPNRNSLLLMKKKYNLCSSSSTLEAKTTSRVGSSWGKSLKTKFDPINPNPLQTSVNGYFWPVSFSKTSAMPNFPISTSLLPWNNSKSLRHHKALKMQSQIIKNHHKNPKFLQSVLWLTMQRWGLPSNWINFSIVW